MKLTLSDMGSLAEVVGAIAVVISLIYVGAQVRDTNRAVRSAAINDANIAVQSWYQMMSSDPEGIDVWLDGVMSSEALPRNEEFRLTMQVQALMYAMQNIYLLSKEGSLDRDVMESLSNVIRPGTRTPGFERYWSQRRGYFHSDFADYIDEILAAPVSPLDEAVEVYRQPTDREE